MMRVEKTEIQRVIHDEPAFSQMFVSHILDKNARVEEDLSIGFSTQPKNDLRDCYCFWPILERKATGANSRKDQSGDAR